MSNHPPEKDQLPSLAPFPRCTSFPSAAAALRCCTQRWDSSICDRFVPVHPGGLSAISCRLLHRGRLSTHLLLRSAPLPVIIEGDTVPPWLSSYIAFTIPPPPPIFLLASPSVRCRIPYRYPKTHSPGQEDPTLANNLQKCVLSL